MKYIEQEKDTKVLLFAVVMQTIKLQIARLSENSKFTAVL
jgi:hypothetical protein